MADRRFDFQQAFADVHKRIDDQAGDINKRLGDISDKQNESSVHLGQIEVHLHDLIGNGKPGRIADLEKDVDTLKKKGEWFKGYAAAVGGAAIVLGAAAHYLVDYLLKPAIAPLLK